MDSFPHSIYQQFHKLVQQFPDQILVIEPQRQYTYREVFDQSKKYVGYFKQEGIGSGHLVILHMSRSSQWIACILALIDLHAVYLPLDPQLPLERKRFLEEQSQAHYLVEWQQGQELPVVRLGQHRGEFLLPAAALYVLYTSGSTGAPKGVIGTQEGLWQRVRWMQQIYPIEPSDVFCLKTPLSFVDHIAEMFQPLLQPAPVLLLPDEEVKDLYAFIGHLKRHRVTRLVVVPSFLRALLQMPPSVLHNLHALRFLFCSGEMLASSLARECMDKLPHIRLINVYGSTEVGADATYYEVTFSQEKEINTLFGRSPADSFSTPHQELEPFAEQYTSVALPERGESVDTYLAHLKREVFPYAVDVAHPRFIGHMTAGLPEGFAKLGELVTQHHQNTVKVETSKAVNFLEKQTVAQLHSLFFAESSAFYKMHAQHPSSCLGLILPGGTLANIQALHIAKHEALSHGSLNSKQIRDRGWISMLHAMGYEGACVIGSELMHYSFKKAALVMGIGTDQVMGVPLNRQGHLCLNALEEKIKESRERKLCILALVGIAGATETGSVDPLEAMAEIAKKENLFFHVDAAWGGPFVFSERLRVLLRGIERADSIALCGHKQLHLPMGTSVLLLKDPQIAGRTAVHANYQSRTASHDQGAFSLMGSKPAHGIYLDAGFKIYGKRGYRYLIEKALQLAQEFAYLIRKNPCFELVQEPQTNIVNYRYIPAALRACKTYSKGAQKKITAVTAAIQKRQFLNAQTFVSYTTLSDASGEIGVFRAVLVNPLTTLTDLTAVLLDQMQIAQESLAEPLCLDQTWQQSSSSDHVPIGYPIEGAEVWILNRELKEVPTGQSGQIYVGGKGLALGYLHDDAETRNRFISWPSLSLDPIYATGDFGRVLPSGVIEYLGREDQQVKVRGCRINLIEVEQALLSLFPVTKAVAVAAEEELFIFYTLAENADRSLELTLKQELKSKLPAYMIPSRWIFLASFPELPSGKVDRKVFFEFLKVQNADPIKKGATLEEELIAFCSHFLHLPEIDPDGNFFDQGFTSLSIHHLLIRLQDKHPDLQLLDLYTYPTVTQLGAYLRGQSTHNHLNEEAWHRRQAVLSRRRERQENLVCVLDEGG